MTMKPIYIVLSAIFFLLVAKPIESHNTLFLGLPYFSHIHPMTSMAKELHKRGHNSYFPVSQHLSKMFKASDGVHFVHMPDIIKMAEFTDVAISIFSGKSNYTLFDMKKLVWDMCDDLLFDQKWFNYLKTFNATLVVVDSAFMSNCLIIIPYKLSIPFIFIGAGNFPSVHRTPWNFAAFPFVATGYSERMSFMERLQNSFIHLLNYIISPLGAPAKSVKHYAPNKPDIPFEELLRKAELHIIESDVLIDYAFPALPNVEYLGGMGTQPAEPLEGDLLKFVHSSKNGIIVVSYGSLVKILPREHIEKMGEAFKVLKYDVVWKWSDTKYSLPNVFMTKWLPQNDLLGHSKTKLFITHCGNAGQFESLYHAVPMLGFPVSADQFHNARRIVDKGYGLSMDLYNYTVEELVATIKEVIENPKYKTNIQQASDIFKSRPEHPSERGARVVDDVIKYGGGFLRSYCQDMPLYQYFMLDVLAFILLLAVVVIAIVVFILRKCLLFCCRMKIKND